MHSNLGSHIIQRVMMMNYRCIILPIKSNAVISLMLPMRNLLHHASANSPSCSHPLNSWDTPFCVVAVTSLLRLSADQNIYKHRSKKEHCNWNILKLAFNHEHTSPSAYYTDNCAHTKTYSLLSNVLIVSIKASLLLYKLLPSSLLQSHLFFHSRFHLFSSDLIQYTDQN